MHSRFGPLHYSLYPLHPTVTKLNERTAFNAIPDAVKKTIEELKIINSFGELEDESIEMLERAENWNYDLSRKKGYNACVIDNFPLNHNNELSLSASGIDGYPSLLIKPTPYWGVDLTENEFANVSDSIINEFVLV